MNVVPISTANLPQQTLPDLVQRLLEARQIEAGATAARIQLEQDIIQLVGVKEEGSETHNAGLFRVTVTGKLSRSMNWEIWDRISGAIAPELHPVKKKRELDEKGVKYLQANEPEIYAVLSQALTVKPGKPSVEVKGV
jgi:hypothetical protein